MSPMRSHTSSMPIDRRTKSSGNVRFSSGIEAWLMVHGISQREFTLPKDTVVLKMRQASQKRRLSSTEPVVKLIMEPWPLACARWMANDFASQPPRPGKYTSWMLACPRRKAAICAAFSCARCTRRCMVLMPLRKRKHSKGASAVPSAFWRKATRCARSGSRTQTRPPVQSAWPEKNFVAECTTMSAPSVNGLQITGGIIVESTLRRVPCRWASSARRFKSEIRILGFDGLSVWIRRVVGVNAFSTAAKSVVSTKFTWMPEQMQSWVSKRCMPP
mmetsp:Transcript_106692/g.308699  ORF Transcript_106692/g.308699 Transcript_106692/m.308699 type:complete len:274 (-) Transcript_106692:178-999(-)